MDSSSSGSEVYGELHSLDYGVIVAYLALSMVIGLGIARKGTKSMSAYFVGSRSMPWWLAGISITATAFAADTPLWIGDMIYRRGIEGTWLHWAPGIGAAAVGTVKAAAAYAKAAVEGGRLGKRKHGAERGAC